MSLEFKGEEINRPLARRLLIAGIGVLFAFLILTTRLAWLQVINTDAYQEKAERNRTVQVTTQGPRGLIFDRNGTLVAGNVRNYTLEITPDKVTLPISKLIDDLSNVIEISAADRRRFLRLKDNFNRYDSIPIRTHLTDSEIATFISQKWRFEGVEVQQAESRVYPLGQTGSHILGYIGSISQSDKKRLEDEGKISLYTGARDIGKVGIERSYEDLLHGQPGEEDLEITASGRSVRTLNLVPPQPGTNLFLTVDFNLQRIAEHAMQGKTGAVIAIEPSTGEILAFASLPTYDPNLFPGGIDPDSWNYLNTAPEKPLLNRAMRGIYPIGSTYKPFMALAGLYYGEISKDFKLNDTGVFMVGNHRFRDVTSTPKGIINVRRSLEVSSDIFYYWLATQLGVDRIYDFMKPWGFGQKTGIDLIGEQTGILPNREWKEKRFKQSWYVGDTPSLGIGQGYNAFTLLQLAHATATLANHGTVIPPHLVRATVNPATAQTTKIAMNPTRKIQLPESDWNLVIQGMMDATRSGTARAIFKNAPYEVAGKTGTAQVISIAQDAKYDSKKISRKHHDHSLFIAFAPARKPKVALAVLVENGGFGAKAAAPIARAIMDYWLTGKNDLGLPPPKLTRTPR